MLLVHVDIAGGVDEATYQEGNAYLDTSGPCRATFETQCLPYIFSNGAHKLQHHGRRSVYFLRLPLQHLHHASSDARIAYAIQNEQLNKFDDLQLTPRSV
jgi:hypothetical protein